MQHARTPKFQLSGPTVHSLYCDMGLVKMQSVCCYWENETRYPRVADVMSRNRFQKIASTIHLQDNLEVTEEQKQDKALV